MTVTYLVIMFILLFCVLGAACATFPEFILDGDKTDRYAWFGFTTLGIIVTLLWPLALALVVPAGMCYGLYSLVKLAGMWRRGELNA